jgi:hypothetical protein
MRIPATVFAAVLVGAVGVKAMATAHDEANGVDAQQPDPAAVPPALPQPPPGTPQPPQPPPPHFCPASMGCAWINYVCLCNGPLHTGFSVDDEIRTIESIEIDDHACVAR